MFDLKSQFLKICLPSRSRLPGGSCSKTTSDKLLKKRTIVYMAFILKIYKNSKINSISNKYLKDGN